MDRLILITQSTSLCSKWIRKIWTQITAPLPQNVSEMFLQLMPIYSGGHEDMICGNGHNIDVLHTFSTDMFSLIFYLAPIWPATQGWFTYAHISPDHSTLDSQLIVWTASTERTVFEAIWNHYLWFLIYGGSFPHASDHNMLQSSSYKHAYVNRGSERKS